MHSEHGPNAASTGRAVNPTIKVTDLAWLEFVKPDLNAPKHSPVTSVSSSPAQARRVVSARFPARQPPDGIRKARTPVRRPTFKRPGRGSAALARATDTRVEPLDEATEAASCG